MAQVLIVGVFTFLFLQLTAGQDAACQAALNTFSTNIASCTPTLQNPTVICGGVCRGYFDDIFASCPAAVSLFTVVASCINSLMTAYQLCICVAILQIKTVVIVIYIFKIIHTIV